MKKVSAIILAVIMALFFVACGDENVKGTVEQTGSQNQSSVPAGGNKTDSDSSEADEFSVGASANNKYENAYFGIGCTLDSNWVFSTDDEIKQMNDMSLDLIGEEYAEAIKNASLIYDMMATVPGGIESVNIVIENVGVLYGSLLSTDEYLDNSVSSVEGALESMGFDNVSAEKGTLVFAGSERPILSVSASVAEFSMNETIVVLKKGNYIASITVASDSEENSKKILSNFYAVD